nr:aminotransferase [uncultured bacterium]
MTQHSTGTRTRLPEQGRPWHELRADMEDMRRHDADWRKGRTSLHVYHPGDEVLDVARQAYGMFMSENALAPAAFPSVSRMEEEVVDMALSLLGGGDKASGSMTSGGTESIILAVRTAWRAFRQERHPRSRSRPHLLLAASAHPAWDKAAELMGLAVVRFPLAADHRACLAELEKRIAPDTVMVVASAPCLPFGTVDPVEQMASIARAHDVWLHVDACLGGFLAPHVAALRPGIPRFDLSVPGVRSLSADLHKFGYAAKGASVLLYADRGDHQWQPFEFGDWPKGLYKTTTLAGTRPGGAVASAWAVMHYLGHQGYRDIARRVMRTRDRYIEGLLAIPGFQLLGSPPLSVLAFTSDAWDIHAIGDAMQARQWYISRLSAPPALHLTVSPAHEHAVDDYLDDLARIVRQGAMPRQTIAGTPRQVVTY